MASPTKVIWWVALKLTFDVTPSKLINIGGCWILVCLVWYNLNFRTPIALVDDEGTRYGYILGKTERSHHKNVGRLILRQMDLSTSWNGTATVWPLLTIREFRDFIPFSERKIWRVELSVVAISRADMAGA
jgi:hypothetical protein